MRAVVIGGSGMIGQSIARQLREEGVEVLTVDRSGRADISCDICRDGLDFFEGVDEVYNLAGVLGTSELETQIPEAVEANIVGAVNVFEKANQYGVQRVFYPSKPNVWRNVYTITKETSENLAAIYNQQRDTRICSLRIFNAYGPHQHLTPVRKIIPTFAIQAMRGLPIQIWGDGEQTVDMIYVGDIAALAIRFVRSETTTVVDCGRGEAFTVNDIAKQVNEHFGNRAGLNHLPMRVGETPNTQLKADLAGLRTAIGEFELSNWKTTLTETLEWYASRPSEEIDNALEFYRLSS